jgi:hypothetical protein
MINLQEFDSIVYVIFINHSTSEMPTPYILPIKMECKVFMSLACLYLFLMMPHYMKICLISFLNLNYLI